MKKGFQLPQCPVIASSKDFLTPFGKAEEFVNAFASTSNDKSLPASKKAERKNLESTAEYRDPECDNTHLKKKL